MAHLVRVYRTRHVDASGKRVPKGTKGAKKVTEVSDKWYGAGVPGQGKKRVPLATDKEAARRMLGDLVRAAERGEAKMLDRAAKAKSLKDHLTDFEGELSAGVHVSTGRKRRTAPSEKQIQQSVQRVRDVLDGCNFRWVDDLKSGTAADRLARYLRERLKKPRNATDRGIGAQTATFILSEARRFAKWLAGKGTGVPADVFDPIAGFDPANDRRHARREVPPHELGKLLDATRASERVYRRTMTGEDRYHLYLTAFATGFRLSELAALTPAHFQLEAEPPTVALPGKTAKNKKSVRPPLPPAVAAALRAYLVGKPAKERIWRGKWTDSAAGMLKLDLDAAGVPYEVDTPAGKEYADFHALRHSFVSSLAATGAGTKELQTLARHSDPRLTLNVYAHARSAALVEAVGRLQIPGAAPSATPFADLNREGLERVILGLCVILGTVLGPPGPFDPRDLGAHRGAHAAGISGNSGEQLDTTTAKREPA